MYKEGDKIIRFTKYGSVHIHTVKNYGVSLITDTKNKVQYERPSIVTDKNICISLDGTDGQIYKINKELASDQCKTFENFAKLPKHEKVQVILNKYANKS